MSVTNLKKTSVVKERLAGGYGPRGARQDNEDQLRRLVMTCLLWEDIAYTDGVNVVESIKTLIPKVPANIVSKMAIEARYDQKLRHVPLLICREMARYDSHKPFVENTLSEVINRPDEMSEFLSLYWKSNDKKSIPSSVKRGLAKAFQKFDEYQLAKWNRNKEISLRDVLFLCHAKPQDQAQDALWKRLINNTLVTPDTWEVGLSAAKTTNDKLNVWVRLIDENKLPAFAFLKNLRNMIDVKVPKSTIIKGLQQLKPTMLLPVDFLKAVKYAPDYVRQLEDLMYRCTQVWPKLPGWSIFVVDVSGSMSSRISNRSEFSRIEVAASMAVLAAEMCENITIYATAGNDGSRIHQTKRVTPYHGFALAEEINKMARNLGGGGIFTRQCLEYIKEQEGDTPDRIIVFSDSQDCDRDQSKKPAPFGKYNYIVDVSNEKHGVNYKGLWTAEISGWSESFLRFISSIEQ